VRQHIKPSGRARWPSGTGRRPSARTGRRVPASTEMGKCRTRLCTLYACRPGDYSVIKTFSEVGYPS